MLPFSLRALLATALLVLASPSPANALLVLLDDMSSPDYSGFSFNSADFGSNPDDASSGDFGALATGGNPDGRLLVEHEHLVVRDDNGDPLNGDGSTLVQSFVNDQSVAYTPSVDGAIASISFSLDILLSDAPGVARFSEVYFNVADSLGGNSAGFTVLSPAPGWQTITVTGLTNTDYSSRDFAGALPLRFGFGFLSDGDVSIGDELIEISVDNFRVDVVPVPEPGTALLLGIGASLLGACRRRR